MIGMVMRFRTTHALCATGDAVTNARQAVREIRAGLDGADAGVIVYFASVAYDPHTLAAEMHAAFPDTITLGCTTAGEGADGAIYNGAVVAMAFSHEAFAYSQYAVVVKDASQIDGKDVFTDPREAMYHLNRKQNDKPIDLDYHQYIGFMLGDATGDFCENVLEVVGEETNVLFVGGFAGNDYTCDIKPHVFYQGKAYRDAAVLSLWKPTDGFALLKTQSVDVSDVSFIITEADEAERIVWKLDGEDAAKVYARAIDAPLETMDLPDFDKHPLASTVDGEPFVRAIAKKVDGRGLRMYTRVTEGMRYTLTHSGDICQTTQNALTEKLREMGGASALLHVNCASRRTALNSGGCMDQFAGIFDSISGISFFSHGEIYVGVVTLTSTMILFK